MLDAIRGGLTLSSPIGTRFNNQSYEAYGGRGSYSDVWPCGIMPYVEALGIRGFSDRVWEEWKRNALATHATVYPGLIAGTWTGSDSYMRPGLPISGQGGIADWQLHNMWSHAAA